MPPSGDRGEGVPHQPLRVTSSEGLDDRCDPGDGPRPRPPPIARPGDPRRPARLGSRYAQRISAEGELARLGRVALPALLAARTSKDAEIRARSAALVDQIGRASLLQSTPVRLDFREVPLAIAVEAIARQSGSRLSIEPAELSELASPKNHAAIRTPPCRSGMRSTPSAPPGRSARRSANSRRGVRSMVGSPWSTARPANRGRSPIPGRSGSGSTVSITGARSSSTGRGRSTRARGWVPRPVGDPTGTVDRATKEFFLVLLASWSSLGSRSRPTVRSALTEALDDLGRSLLEPVGPGGFRHEAGYFGLIPSTMVSAPVDLLYPEVRRPDGSSPFEVRSR